jgi:hypothetical protein
MKYYILILIIKDRLYLAPIRNNPYRVVNIGARTGIYPTFRICKSFFYQL